MKDKQYKISGYNITGAPAYMKDLFPVPPELERQLEDLHKEAVKGKQSSIKRFIKLIEKYPKVPVLKNYLSVIYSNIGNMQKAREVNHWLISEHPDYLFGKLNLASEYLQNEEYEKIPEVLGEYMELKALYPERKTFHIIEVSGFLKIASMYFSAIGNLEQAEMRIDMLNEIVPDSIDYQVAEEAFQIATMKAALKRAQEAEKNRIKVKINKTQSGNKTEMPEFTHPEIKQLYKYGLDIDKEIVEEIIALPRKTLISDLEKVLNDSIDRYNYFQNGEENGNITEDETNFAIHASFILAELEAEESLNTILNFLKQDEEFINYYLSDILTEYFWQVLYKTGRNKLNTLLQFMKMPGIYEFCKSEVLETANQIVFRHPERKGEIIEWYAKIINFFLNSKLEDNVIDNFLNGFLVNGILDIKGNKLIGQVEMLYKKEIVDLDACGDFEEVKTHLKEDKNSYKREILPIFDIYEEINNWSTPTDDNSFNDYKEITEPIRTEKKIGRNDPCPCGSGKKYKKCCLNK